MMSTGHLRKTTDWSDFKEGEPGSCVTGRLVPPEEPSTVPLWVFADDIQGELRSRIWLRGIISVLPLPT